MNFREFHYRWEWELQSSPEALWPLISDTNRFNRDASVPAIERSADAGVRLTTAPRRLRLMRLGLAVEWEEEPFEWVRPLRFGVKRRYLTGPVAAMRVLVELAPSPNGGSHLIYQVWAQPRNWFGLIAIPVQIGVLSARNFDVTIRRYDRMAVRGISAITQPENARFAPGGRERLASLRDALLAQKTPPALVAHLVGTIETADDFTLAQLRPYALADLWQAPRRSVLELCLMATRAGLLEFCWKLLCPLCRGAKETSMALRDLKSQVHCESCNIDFTANFERSVELTFRPTPAVREIKASEFCIGGPQITPHIVVQQILPAGAQRRVRLALEFGRYRLRTIELPGGQYLRVTKDGSANATFRAEMNGWPDHEISLSTQPELNFENATPHEQLFVLERMAWSDQAVTAAEVIALQLFRDLFASEALRPGEEFSVGSVAIVFTDLRGSTRLYREIGDAVAFGCVLNHFAVLKETIAAEGGAVVKTIGDAVMAVFRRPAPALRAMLTAQQKVASPADGSRPLPLKAGVHYGPCIAVTLNDRLDYFGSTINVAARLEGQSSGSDVIVSAPVRNDPEVTAWLEQHAESIRVESLETLLKGFDEQRFALWRVAPRKM